jgi:hypothetical protein
MSQIRLFLEPDAARILLPRAVLAMISDWTPHPHGWDLATLEVRRRWRWPINKQNLNTKPPPTAPLMLERVL